MTGGSGSLVLVNSDWIDKNAYGSSRYLFVESWWNECKHRWLTLFWFNIIALTLLSSCLKMNGCRRVSYKNNLCRRWNYLRRTFFDSGSPCRIFMSIYVLSINPWKRNFFVHEIVKFQIKQKKVHKTQYSRLKITWKSSV